MRSIRAAATLQDKLVVTIDIGDDGLEQVGALDQAGADRRPLRCVDEQRNVRKRPLALIGADLS